MDISSRITKLRDKLNLTQEAFGELVNVSQRTVAAWEAGERNPSFAKLCELADQFDVSIDYLLGRTDDPRLFSNAQKNPSPDDRERTLAAAEAARRDGPPITSNLTVADKEWIEERIRTALGLNPKGSESAPDN